MIRSRGSLVVALAICATFVAHAEAHDPAKDRAGASATKPSGPPVTLELQAGVQGSLPWRFWPDHRLIRARRGESIRIVYRARSLGERPITGKAVHTIIPDGIEEHLDLVECFCLVQATLAPGEERTFPLVVRLRPTLPRTVRRVTLRYEFGPEVSSGTIALPSAPPPSGTLEVWAKATRPNGWRGNPLPIRAVAVGMEGQVSPEMIGWFQVPTIADGVPLKGDGERSRLLRSTVPAGSYRAIRLQVLASPGMTEEASTAVLLHSAPVPIVFTLLPGETTILMLDLALREDGGRSYEVHIEEASIYPSSRALGSGESPAGSQSLAK